MAQDFDYFTETVVPVAVTPPDPTTTLAQAITIVETQHPLLKYNPNWLLASGRVGA